MGRSNGYRATNANRKHVHDLRKLLAATPGSEWQKARRIMQELTRTLGHRGGPSGGSIDPRACTYCDYYGHTKQWCKKRIADEEAQIDAELRADARWLARHAVRGPRDPDWSAWLAWANNLRQDTVDSGWVCTEREATCAAEYVACETCDGCAGRESFSNIQLHMR